MRVVTLNDKGGVSKTLTADLAIAVLESIGEKPAIADVDRERKLTSILKSAQRKPDFIISPPNLAAARSEDLSTYFAPVLDFLAQHESCVIDVGANLATPLLDNAAVANHGEDFDSSNLTFLFCTTADGQAESGAMSLLKRATDVYPRARRVVVANEKDGKINLAAYEKLSLDAIVVVPREPGPLMSTLFTTSHIRLPILRQMTKEDVQKLLDEPSATKAKMDVGYFGLWYDPVFAALKQAIVGNVVEMAAKKAK